MITSVIENSNSFTQLILQAESELERVKNQLKQAQAMEQALLNSISALRGAAGDHSVKTLSDKDYPFKSSRQEKVKFLIKKFNVPMRILEITDEIIRLEGEDSARKISKGLNYTMNQMVANGELVIAKLNMSNRHLFYCLPEFFSSLEKGNVTIKAEHVPPSDSKTWAKLPIEERNFENAEWIVHRSRR